MTRTQDIRKWKDLPWPQIGRINVVKIAIIKSQHNSSQILKEQYSTSYGKIKQNKQTKKPWIAKTTLYNKKTSKGISTSDFKLYYRAIEKKTTCYWHKNRQVDQRD